MGRSQSSTSFKPTPRPPFPEPGSTVGPNGKYFSLCQLGHGTFCAISKCINLAYHHHHISSSSSSNNDGDKMNLRIVAAKVELSSFTNSGVLDGEATILAHLCKNMPQHMTPRFLDYIKTDSRREKKKDDQSRTEISAIIMEYLAGEDMHQLRDRHAQILAKQTNAFDIQSCRRLSAEDSVYLCRNIFLPLLQSMHDCGVIHRDVKPSNCVRTGTGEMDRDFKLVDFGLSKSFVVPRDSSYANNDCVWEGAWDDSNASMSNSNNNNHGGSPSQIQGCIRKERDGAEFRGTSMYASLRVHQLRDYCRRDDIWGLLYVFLDLVTGGLPWMGYAANRDRQMCQIIKEWVHGEREHVHVKTSNSTSEDFKSSNGTKVCKDMIEELLKGAEYHLSKHRRDAIVAKAKKNGDETSSIPESELPPLAPPLAMMHDQTKIEALRQAFDHVAKLEFQDRPDYDFIGRCMDRFLENSLGMTTDAMKNTNNSEKKDKNIPSINWKQPCRKEMDQKRWDRMGKVRKDNKGMSSLRPSLVFLDDKDPLSEDTLEEAENKRQLAAAQLENSSSSNPDGGASAHVNSNNSAEVNDVTRLPLEFQFRLAQVEYNAANPDTIPIHLAFRDWMELATSLVYDTWDSSKYERGNHRSNDDGYRRELYLRIVYQCIEAAKPFGNFCSRDCFEFEYGDDDDGNGENGSSRRARKRRRIRVNESKLTGGDSSPSSKSCLLAFSKVFCALRASIDIERERIFAPPPTLSFGSGV